jgi:hypothetical protein
MQPQLVSARIRLAIGLPYYLDMNGQFQTNGAHLRCNCGIRPRLVIAPLLRGTLTERAARGILPIRFGRDGGAWSS